MRRTSGYLKFVVMAAAAAIYAGLMSFHSFDTSGKQCLADLVDCIGRTVATIVTTLTFGVLAMALTTLAWMKVVDVFLAPRFHTWRLIVYGAVATGCSLITLVITKFILNM